MVHIEVVIKQSNIKGKNIMEERKQIGWCEREEGFYKMYAPVTGQIVTKAFVFCKYCNGTIYHCTGPKYDAVNFSLIFE